MKVNLNWKKIYGIVLLIILLGVLTQEYDWMIAALVVYWICTILYYLQKTKKGEKYTYYHTELLKGISWLFVGMILMSIYWCISMIEFVHGCADGCGSFVVHDGVELTITLCLEFILGISGMLIFFLETRKRAFHTFLLGSSLAFLGLGWNRYTSNIILKYIFSILLFINIISIIYTMVILAIKSKCSEQDKQNAEGRTHNTYSKKEKILRSLKLCMVIIVVIVAIVNLFIRPEHIPISCY